MENPVKIRGLEIGSGRPKIAIPIVGKTREEIVEAAARLRGAPCDLAEWRADYYAEIQNFDQALETARLVRASLGETPLLFTFRTRQEGGEREMDGQAYGRLNQAMAESGYADAVDVEMFLEEDVVRETLSHIHAAGLPAVGSNHDFSATPPKEELVRRLRKMQELGADILKIAVMPGSTADVLTLLCAASEMSERYAERPLVAISMSAKGVVSRMCGEIFGSCIAFGAVGQGSAPGQIPAEELAFVLDTLHKSLHVHLESAKISRLENEGNG